MRPVPVGVKQGETRARTPGPLDLFRPQYLRLLLLGLAGVCLIVLGSSMTKAVRTSGSTSQSSPYSLKEEEQSLARQIEEVVSAIKGVGKVRAAVTLERGPESVYARNVTSSRTSSSERTGSDTRDHLTENESSQPVTGRLGGTDSVLIERVEAVKVAGCLVVAEGVSSSRVKLEVYRAVETLLGLPVSKIQVVPMKGGK